MSSLSDLLRFGTKHNFLRLTAIGTIIFLLLLINAYHKTDNKILGSRVSSSASINSARVNDRSMAEAPSVGVIPEEESPVGVPGTREENSIEAEGHVHPALSDDKLENSHVVDLKYHWDKAIKKNHNASYWSAESQLLEGLIPPNVHYMWCGNKWFEFRDYLSVMSVLRSVSPDKITIHYEHPLGVDKLFYHQWLDYLKHDYPYLVMVQMDERQRQFCLQEDRELRIQLILEILNIEGGLYISHRTWLLSFPPQKRKIDFEMAIAADSVDGYILMRQGSLSTQEVRYQDLLNSTSLKVHRTQCDLVHHVFQGHDKEGCLLVSGGRFDHFFPMDIWELDNSFGRLTRRLFYGTEEIRRPKPSYDELVPNIGHMVWIGGGEMDYVFYLSLLSMLFVVKVDVVYLHGDQPPTGKHWQSIENTPRIRDRIKLIIKTPPTHIFQGEIEPWYRALMSDLIRVDLMIKYGGIYADTDAIWVKGLSYEDRGYDAVASYDWVDWSWPYPDSVNFGLSYGKKNAPFWQLFRDSMRTLHNDVHGFTGVMNPYKILERYCQFIH